MCNMFYTFRGLVSHLNYKMFWVLSHGFTLIMWTSPIGHLPVVVVSVVGAEHHAIVNGHGAVFTEEFQWSFQETVASITGITIDRQHIVGRLWLDGELAILSMDLNDSTNHVSFIPNWYIMIWRFLYHLFIMLTMMFLIVF